MIMVIIILSEHEALVQQVQQALTQICTRPLIRNPHRFSDFITLSPDREAGSRTRASTPSLDASPLRGSGDYAEDPAWIYSGASEAKQAGLGAS